MKKKSDETFTRALQDSVRIHDACLDGIASLLHEKTITIEGKECQLVVTQNKGALLLDVMNPSENLTRYNFRMIYTGEWDVPGSTVGESDG